MCTYGSMKESHRNKDKNKALYKPVKAKPSLYKKNTSIINGLFSVSGTHVIAQTQASQACTVRPTLMTVDQNRVSMAPPVQMASR